MGALVDDEPGCLDGCIGATTTAVQDGDDSILLLLSDGSVMEICADGDGGFEIFIHTGAMH